MTHPTPSGISAPVLHPSPPHSSSPARRRCGVGTSSAGSLRAAAALHSHTHAPAPPPGAAAQHNTQSGTQTPKSCPASPLRSSFLEKGGVRSSLSSAHGRSPVRGPLSASGGGTAQTAPTPQHRCNHINLKRHQQRKTSFRDAIRGLLSCCCRSAPREFSPSSGGGCVCGLGGRAAAAGSGLSPSFQVHTMPCCEEEEQSAHLHSDTHLLPSASAPLSSPAAAACSSSMSLSDTSTSCPLSSAAISRPVSEVGMAPGSMQPSPLLQAITNMRKGSRKPFTRLSASKSAAAATAHMELAILIPPPVAAPASNSSNAVGQLSSTEDVTCFQGPSFRSVLHSAALYSIPCPASSGACSRDDSALSPSPHGQTLSVGGLRFVSNPNSPSYSPFPLTIDSEGTMPLHHQRQGSSPHSDAYRRLVKGGEMEGPGRSITPDIVRPLQVLKPAVSRILSQPLGKEGAQPRKTMTFEHPSSPPPQLPFIPNVVLPVLDITAAPISLPPSPALSQHASDDTATPPPPSPPSPPPPSATVAAVPATPVPAAMSWEERLRHPLPPFRCSVMEPEPCTLLQDAEEGEVGEEVKEDKEKQVASAPMQMQTAAPVVSQPLSALNSVSGSYYSGLTTPTSAVHHLSTTLVSHPTAASPSIHPCSHPFPPSPSLAHTQRFVLVGHKRMEEGGEVQPFVPDFTHKRLSQPPLTHQGLSLQLSRVSESLSPSSSPAPSPSASTQRTALRRSPSTNSPVVGEADTRTPNMSF